MRAFVNAIQFTGQNDNECLKFCPYARDPKDVEANLIIDLPYGHPILCSIGDYIIKDLNGIFHVCKEEKFNSLFVIQCEDNEKENS